MVKLNVETQPTKFDQDRGRLMTRLRTTTDHVAVHGNLYTRHQTFNSV